MPDQRGIPVTVAVKDRQLRRAKRGPIAVVGDAEVTEPDAAYKTAFDLGRNLARSWPLHNSVAVGLE